MKRSRSSTRSTRPDAARRARRAGCAAALLAGLAALPLAARAQQAVSEAERECREWAHSFFSEQTERREEEVARCVAARDPASPQAQRLREQAVRRAQARSTVAKRQEQEALKALAQDEAETRRRCGGELVEALGPLHFCDTPDLVARKAAAVEDLRCLAPESCDRLHVRLGNAELWAYPKYSERGLWHLALYAEERTATDYYGALRDDWQRVVTAMEALNGPAIGGGSPYPDFFAVEGVEVVETHRWELGRRQIRVGVFAADAAYAARLTIDDATQVDTAKRRPR